MNVKISLLFKEDISTQEKYISFFAIFHELYPRLLPEWCGHQGDKEEFNSRALARWTQSSTVEWGGGKEKVRGHYMQGIPFGKHDVITLKINSKKTNSSSLSKLLQSIVHSFDVDYMACYTDYDEDFSDIEYYKKHMISLENGFNTFKLRDGIPSVTWSMFIGNDLLKLCSVAPALKTTVNVFDETSNGLYLQLFDELEVPHDQMKAKREEVQALLGDSIFVGSLAESYPAFEI